MRRNRRREVGGQSLPPPGPFNARLPSACVLIVGDLVDAH